MTHLLVAFFAVTWWLILMAFAHGALDYVEEEIER